MAKIMVDYTVWLGVEVDTETGEVLRVAHSDDIQAQQPDSFFDGEHEIDDDSEDAVKALKIVERLDLLDGDVRWKYA
jgi:hypothetical protein